MTDPDLLTEGQAADLIGWSTSNLRNRRRQLTEARDAGEESDAAPRFRRIVGGRGGDRVYYPRRSVLAWLKRHPEIATRDKIVEVTISQDEVCDLLGLSRSALRKRRARLRAGDDTAAPPHVYAHQEVRYRRSAVAAWAKRVRWDLQQS